MTKERYTFKPSDVAELVGISNTVQRDRRRRGSHYFGHKGENGKWLFSARDLIGLAVSEIVIRQLNDVFEAERAGHWCAAEVAKHLGIATPDWWEILPRKAIAAGSVQSLGQGLKYMLFAKGQNPIFSDDLNCIKNLDCETALVLDLEKVAKAIPNPLVAAVKKQAEFQSYQ